MSTVELFSHFIGNPPYQLNVGELSGIRNTVDIFPDFQELGSNISKASALVYPATWQKNINSGLGFDLLKDFGLKGSETLLGETVFPGFILPVSMVYTERNYEGPVYLNGQEQPRSMEKWIDSVLAQKLLKRTAGFPKSPGGVLSSPTWRNAEYVSDKVSLAETKERRIKILLKAAPGKQADAKTYWTSEEILKNEFPDHPLDKWKVGVRQRIFGRQALYVAMCFTRRGGEGMRPRVFPPGETFGSTWGLLAAFDTREEAENYRLYLGSPFSTHMGYLDYQRVSFGSHIPDLLDYTSNNPLFKEDYELPVDHPYRGLTFNQRLAHYFGLAADEIELLDQPPH